jgi:hypothetical protein
MRPKMTPALAGLALSVAAAGCAFPLAHHTAPSPAPPATRTEAGRPTPAPASYLVHSIAFGTQQACRRTYP